MDFQAYSTGNQQLFPFRRFAVIAAQTHNNAFVPVTNKARVSLLEGSALCGGARLCAADGGVGGGVSSLFLSPTASAAVNCAARVQTQLDENKTGKNMEKEKEMRKRESQDAIVTMTQYRAACWVQPVTIHTYVYVYIYTNHCKDN